MNVSRPTIGFDRELHLQWLDAVASRAACGDEVAVVRTWLNAYLADSIGGMGHGGNRGKTITVLCRIWASPPRHCRSLRDLGLQILSQASPIQRMPLHWGMTLAAYPFFGDVMDALGRLLALQGDVQRRDVIRRMYETWGERPAVSRASRAAWQSAILWGALGEMKQRGRYATAVKPIGLSRGVDTFVVEAALHWARTRPLPVSSLATLPCLFPFDMTRAQTSVRTSKRVHISREGGDLELVRMSSPP